MTTAGSITDKDAINIFFGRQDLAAAVDESGGPARLVSVRGVAVEFGRDAEGEEALDAGRRPRWRFFICTFLQDT